MKVGFAGLGTMGVPMATNLLTAGYELCVWNRTAAKADALVGSGAERAADPRELGRSCDVVITMVADGPDVRAVALGDEGLLAEPNPGLLWIDCSSISPAIAKELASAAHDAGVDVVDAPVSGGSKGATDATLSIMVGGSVDAFARARPILETLGSQVVHVGDTGAGQVAKLVNQLIVGGTIALVAEGFALAERLGASPASVRDALAGGFADSRVLQVHGQRMLDGDFAPGFRSVLQRKDLRNALDAAGDAGVALPATATVFQLYTALCGIGEGELDHSGLAVLERKISGLHP